MTLKDWRLIPLHEGTGAEHMAIDSWLLDQHIKGLQPSCLRFYTWREPTLSLGYHQRSVPSHWHDLHWQGQRVEQVRRPTGGRAVLHQGDLTYALVTSGLTGSRRDVYRQLCQFLLEGFQSIGVYLGFGEAGRGYIQNPNCFGTATAADLVMENGYKLIGSAQAYREGCVLQHGSIRLAPDGHLFETIFGEKLFPPEMPGPFSMETSPIAKRLPLVAEALMLSASKCLQARFTTAPLTSAEVQAALSNFTTSTIHYFH